MKDGDVYFFFNESDETQSRTATLAGTGAAHIWDASKGTISPLVGASKVNDGLSIPLKLGPFEARLIVLGQ